jgi:hypothetical protein
VTNQNEAAMLSERSESQNVGELFGGDAPAEIRQQIEAAKLAPRDQICDQLWAIQARAPNCLPIYYLLYKLHAGRREFAQAECAALIGLDRAAAQCGLPVEADLISASALPTPNADFNANGPARFWLFTLKALAFIRMRSGRLHEARELIEWIGRCDPSHGVGSDVTAALLAGAMERAGVSS